MRKPATTAKNRRGTVLIIVLWCLIILSVVVANFAFLVRTETRIVANHAEDSRLRAIASSGIEMAIAVLKADTEFPDSQLERWSSHEDAFQQYPIGDGTFSVIRHVDGDEGIYTAYGLEDEASKINLRTASEEMLRRLDGMTPELVAALLDWQDEDSEPRENGAELDYYSALDPPRPIRNGKLATVEEVLLVAGFTPSLLHGSVDPIALMNAAEETAPPSQSAIPPPVVTSDAGDEAEDVPPLGLLPYVTVHSRDRNQTSGGQKRINITKASEEELKSGIPGLTDDEAKAIVSHRGDDQFESIGELLLVREAQAERPQQENQQRGRNQRGRQRQQQQREQNQEENQGRLMFDKARFKAIADHVTISDDDFVDGRININTASARVLAALPDVSAATAARIVATRSEEQRSYQNIGELLDIQGISQETFIKIAELVTVRSDQFRVTSRAEIPEIRTTRTATAVLDRSGETIKILYWNVR